MTKIASLAYHAMPPAENAVYDPRHIVDYEARMIALCVATKGKPAVDAFLCDAYPGGKLPPGEPVVLTNPTLPPSATNPVIPIFPKWPLPSPNAGDWWSPWWVKLLITLGVVIVLFMFIKIAVRIAKRSYRRFRRWLAYR
jgi:hypothetical protein